MHVLQVETQTNEAAQEGYVAVKCISEGLVNALGLEPKRTDFRYNPDVMEFCPGVFASRDDNACYNVLDYSAPVESDDRFT